MHHLLIHQLLLIILQELHKLSYLATLTSLLTRKHPNAFLIPVRSRQVELAGQHYRVKLISLSMQLQIPSPRKRQSRKDTYILYAIVAIFNQLAGFLWFHSFRILSQYQLIHLIARHHWLMQDLFINQLSHSIKMEKVSSWHKGIKKSFQILIKLTVKLHLALWWNLVLVKLHYHLRTMFFLRVVIHFH